MILKEFLFCTECGSQDLKRGYSLKDGLAVCSRCGQEIWEDIDYTEVIARNLGHWYNGDEHPSRYK